MVSGVFKYVVDLDSEVDTNDSNDSRRFSSRLGEFIGGSENAVIRFAVDALTACDGESAIRYSPLYIHGNSGVGKTLLARYVASQYRFNRGGGSVVFISAIDFARQFIRASQKKMTSCWLSRLRDAELLVMDDIQTLSSKPRTQDILIHLIDEFGSTCRPMVFTAERLATAVSDFSPRLVSRLSAGVALCLHPPGQESKCEILNTLTRKQKLKLGQMDLESVAARLQGTVPDIISSLNQSAFAMASVGAALNPLDSIDLGLPRDRCTNVHAIIRTVARHYQIPLSQIVGPSRRRSVVFSRKVAIYLVRELTGLSFARIGEHFNNRDHSTAMHAYHDMACLLRVDADIEHALNDIQRTLAKSSLE